MILFLILLILLSASFSGSETALFSISPITLKSYNNSQNPRLMLIGKLMQRPREVLVTILMLNILVNILIQNTVSILFDPFHSWVLKIVVPLALTLIFGEVIPKSVAHLNHGQIAYFIAPFIHCATIVFRFIREPLAKITSWISRIFFFFLREEKKISAAELRHVLKSSEEQGVLTQVESELISGVLDLQSTLVKEHMRPRAEIRYYDIQKPVSELIHLFVDQQVSKVPVCDGDLDNLKGILTVSDYFFQKKETDLLSLLKKPYFAPESAQGWTLLRLLRDRGVDLAMVVDEYGSISGLITQEDLAEAVIGEIMDVRDTEKLYTRSSDEIIIASGKLELSEFKDLFGMSLKSEEGTVTLGGWLIEQLGDIPVTGAKYVTDQFLFHVLQAEPNRVTQIYVRRLKK